MPHLLKRETRQRIAVSCQALRLAFHELATPRAAASGRQPGAGALEMGLIGVAAELALSACLIEVSGVEAVLRDGKGSMFLTAGEALAKFKELLASAAPKVGVLTAEVENPKEHLRALRTAAVHWRAGAYWEPNSRRRWNAATHAERSCSRRWKR